MYKSAKNADFDRHEMTIYEEVAKMPPFHRKTLVLVGKDTCVKEYRFLKKLLLRKSGTGRVKKKFHYVI